MVTKTSQSSGFALIVVLSALSIIAILFAIAASQILSQLQDAETDIRIAKRAQDNVALVRLASQAYGPNGIDPSSGSEFSLSWRGEEIKMRLQDVGGLIDLNTANPDLLEQFCRGIGVSAEELRRYVSWRQKSNRLLRTSDFLKVTGAEIDLVADLNLMATVHSGRQGIATEQAPRDLLNAILPSSSGAQDPENAIPAQWRSPASNSNYSVLLINSNGALRSLGVVYFAPGRNGQILEIN